MIKFGVKKLKKLIDLQLKLLESVSNSLDKIAKICIKNFCTFYPKKIL